MDSEQNCEINTTRTFFVKSFQFNIGVKETSGYGGVSLISVSLSGVQDLILRTDTGYLCTVCNKVIRHMGSCTRHVKEKHLGIARSQALQGAGGLM